MSLFFTAIKFAAVKHREQRRKDAKATPYINQCDSFGLIPQGKQSLNVKFLIWCEWIRLVRQPRESRGRREYSPVQGFKASKGQALWILDIFLRSVNRKPLGVKWFLGI
ncbi:hypothetical protein PN36_25130 [Candidatus Thiomargarita nelsonii]|uniref:Uncharacterized protein n=1 Tax=Candidatus Thiomargarita nelsonii TaxID=1003181 RepID=A0A0A6P443_9GAMM|nr:hypothetical protein PN36_25130 [Candidatus Thiomargarita nelsonii]